MCGFWIPLAAFHKSSLLAYLIKILLFRWNRSWGWAMPFLHFAPTGIESDFFC
ncbi:hypothetical protein HMPREF0202_01966 [Cetobacterium somerae ATCC BAA-474]|uniref:Uncharacterized protein n=1 Tax=Cetobacterium somerae ATCC BAA-474 TaxID=1319815 RepID=U7V8Y8_9FUSO|nr:hypothetical protein HMPREF0202_01966 [Cetobacterium somerae ATCC BAA-474]